MKKSAIIESGIEEFGRCDYEGASINSIIEKSGTSKGTFYHYFKSKENLYLELIALAVKEKISFLSNNADENISTNNIFEIIHGQIELSIEFAMINPQFACFSDKIANEPNREIKKKAQYVIGNATTEHFSRLINLNIEQNIIRSDIPEEFISQIFVYMISRFNDFLLTSGLKVDLENTAKIKAYLGYYIDFLENGLGDKNQT